MHSFVYLTHLEAREEIKIIILFVFWFKWEQENLPMKFTDLYGSQGLPVPVPLIRPGLDHWHVIFSHARNTHSRFIGFPSMKTSPKKKRIKGEYSQVYLSKISYKPLFRIICYQVILNIFVNFVIKIQF